MTCHVMGHVTSHVIGHVTCPETNHVISHVSDHVTSHVITPLPLDWSRHDERSSVGTVLLITSNLSIWMCKNITAGVYTRTCNF